MSTAETMAKIFDEGYKAFSTVEQNARGFYMLPGNPHWNRASAFHKEWERGYNRAYAEQKFNNRQTGI